MEKYSLGQLEKIMETLRSEHGCPWDREQTHASLKTCMVEEAYEVCEAIDRMEDNGSYENLCEELGDVMFQVVMHSQIASEAGKFNMDDVLRTICEKMIRRHPHVFFPNGEVRTDEALSTQEVSVQWDKIKEKEKQTKSLEETIQDIPKAFPALIRSQKVVKKAKGKLQIQEDYQSIRNRTEKLLQSLDLSVQKGQIEQFDEKIGNLLFEMVNMACFLQLNAENSLTNATNKFINKLIDVEHLAKANGVHLREVSKEHFSDHVK